MTKTIINSIRFTRGLHERASTSNSGVHPSTNEPGQFTERTYTNGAGSRHYKLYVPPKGSRGHPRALIVLLHGCTQNPDDFASGTRMNQIAAREEFLVVYPAQAISANGMRCWNWFEPRNQVRDEGEASLIAGISREVMTEFQLSSRCVFVAGLSAGAAMAAIMGVVYPDLFSAVGVVAGLPYRAARSLQSAFAAMNNGAATPEVQKGDHAVYSVPTIVFHGDRDTTVSVKNGWKVVDQAVGRYAASNKPLKAVQKRTAAQGREITLTAYYDAEMRSRVEYWVVHGAGHSWSGGSDTGSHTDPRGPDASEEMVRFFMSQSRLDR